MPKTTKSSPELLTGWAKIAKFLGQPVAVAQRWAKDGMPVERKGRSMTASPEQLSKWLGRESGAHEPVHITQSQEDDLLKDLRRGLKEASGTNKQR
jgi:hypothetical protein